MSEQLRPQVRRIPRSVQALDRIPNDEYNFEHTIVQEAPVQMSIVLWNLIDFAHVNWMHTRTYHHCKVLAEKGHSHLIEYGVKQFFFLKLPISFKYLMWHEFIPPNIVRHISRSPWGSYTKTEVRLEEFKQDGVTKTRLFHKFYMRLPKFLRPLHGLIVRYIESWSAILWEEDSSMLLRRQKVLATGFKDHPAALDLEVKGVEGFAAGGNHERHAA